LQGRFYTLQLAEYSSAESRGSPAVIVRTGLVWYVQGRTSLIDGSSTLSIGDRGLEGSSNFRLSFHAISLAGGKSGLSIASADILEDSGCVSINCCALWNCDGDSSITGEEPFVLEFENDRRGLARQEESELP